MDGPPEAILPPLPRDPAALRLWGKGHSLTAAAAAFFGDVVFGPKRFWDLSHSPCILSASLSPPAHQKRAMFHTGDFLAKLDATARDKPSEAST